MQSNCCLEDLLKYSVKRKAHIGFFFQHEARPKIPTPISLTHEKTIPATVHTFTNQS